MESNRYRLELINRIAERNDKHDFNILFDLYYGKLLKVATFFLNSDDYAEDIVSEVFVKFLNLGPKIKQINNPDQYFFIATKNQALSYLKKRKKDHLAINHHQINVSLFTSSPENQMIQKELAQVIESTIQNFPIKRKIIFEMIKDENMSYKEVAQHLDLSIKAIEKHMFLSLKALRASLDQYFSETESNHIKTFSQLISGRNPWSLLLLICTVNF